MTFALLAKPVGTVDLMLFLHEKGPMSVSAILTDTGMNNEKFYNAAERLKSLDLVYEYEEPGASARVFLTLTRAGQEMVAALAPAVAALSGTAKFLEDELARLEGSGEEGSVARRTEILQMLADKEYEAGRWEEAIPFASRLLQLAEERGNREGEIYARLALGRIAQRRDRHEDALPELESAIRLADAAGVGPPAIEAEYLIGSSLERQGRLDDARRLYESAGARAVRTDDRRWAAIARLGTARILGRQGRLEESLAVHHAVVAELEAIGAEDELPRAYASLGSTAYHLNRPDALSWSEKAIAAARRVGDARIEAFGLSNAAAQWIDTGEFRKAEAALRRALPIHEGLGDRTGVVAAELNFANLYAAQDRWSLAEERFDRAYALARETRNRFQEASVLFNRGQMMKRRDHPQEARGLLLEAKRLFTEMGNAARARRCDEELADLTG